MGFSGRLFKRKEQGVPVVFQVTPRDKAMLTSSIAQYEYFNAWALEMEAGKPKTGAEIIDSSLDGISFETTIPLKPGEIIKMNMVNFHQIPFGNQSFPICEAKVVWCNQKGKGDEICYKVGARRLRTKELPAINFKTQKFGSVKCF